MAENGQHATVYPVIQGRQRTHAALQSWCELRFELICRSGLLHSELYAVRHRGPRPVERRNLGRSPLHAGARPAEQRDAAGGYIRHERHPH